MIQVAVSINYISGERLWEPGKPMPPGVHVSTNVSILGVETRDERLSVPFVVGISYTPSVAQISMRGNAVISGDKSELENIREDYKRQRTPPPPMLVQTITNASLIEATMLSRSLNIPPPLPLPTLPPPKKPEEPSYVG